MKYFFFILFLCSILASTAQTNTELINSGVHVYNELKGISNRLDAKMISTEGMLPIMDKYTEMTSYFDKVIEGSFEEKEVIRYFKMNAAYEIGFNYGKVGKNQLAYEYLVKIKDDMMYYSENRFPLKYLYDGKQYAIKYSNFESTRMEYFTAMCEICSNLNKTSEAIYFGKLSISNPATSAWFRYITLSKLMGIKEKAQNYDKELLDFNLQFLDAYIQAKPEYDSTIKANKYPTQATAFKILNAFEEQKSPLLKGEYYRGKMAPKFAELKKYDMASVLYYFAIVGGYEGVNYQYINDATESAVRALDEDMPQKGNGYKAGKLLLTLTLEKLESTYSSNLACSDWDRIASYYSKYLENQRKASELTRKAKDCFKEAAHKEAVAKRQSNRYDLHRHLYIGTYPLTLITQYNRYRDYGLVAGHQSTRFGLEFSYKLIKKNLYMYDDFLWMSIFKNNEINVSGYQVKWSGYRAHMSMKFGKRGNSDGYYWGPLFEYVNRTFEPMKTNILSAATNSIILQDQYFSPKDQSFTLYLNFGIHKATKGTFVDYFLGFGGYYGIYNPGTAYYHNPDYKFSNPILENRQPNRIGGTIRCGIMVGLASGH